MICCKNQKQFVQDLAKIVKQKPLIVWRDLVDDENFNFCQYCGKEVCPHTNTVALNEEGNAGVYCSDCGEKLSDEV